MISNRQEEIINGSLLGDGYLEHRSGKARLRFRSVKKEYIEKMLLEMLNLTTGKISLNAWKWRHYYFSTLSLLELNIYWNKFYKDGKKRIPIDIEDFLTPLSLAIWVMDDGHKSRGNLILNTHIYNILGKQRILIALKSKYNIEGTINKDRDKYRI